MERHTSHTTWELWIDICHTQLGNDGETYVTQLGNHGETCHTQLRSDGETYHTQLGRDRKTCVTHNLGVMERHVTYTTCE